MKIIMDHEYGKLKLREIKYGECFLWNNKIYFKTDGCQRKNYMFDLNYCVSLENGEEIHLYRDTYVTPIKTNIVVKNVID